MIGPRFATTVALAALALLAAEPADAFRCKNKLVRDGMHEQQVIALCGEPTTRRHLGYAVRGYVYDRDTRYPGGFVRRTYPLGGTLTEEVVITEFVYNFGPIETIGYGYLEE